MPTPPAPVFLRQVEPSDLDVLFGHMQDAEAVRMAAFTPDDPSDREAFDAHWDRILGESGVTTRAIVLDEAVVGHIASFDMFGEREITYWIGREVWGRGIATEALEVFLRIDDTRPIFARAAADNAGSIRVLVKCGFEQIGTDRGFANARGEEISEVVMRLL